MPTNIFQKTLIRFTIIPHNLLILIMDYMHMIIINELKIWIYYLKFLQIQES